jgi:peptidoglycan/xylan/chitin deacetylase (PgdA/CDA1 family)
MLFDVCVAKWKNNADCAFILYYDDGCESALEYVVPVLNNYNLPGTFYLCYGWLQNDYPERLKRWIEVAKNENIVIGNHTLTHGGATNIEDVAQEILLNNQILREINGIDNDALVSFASPGGVPWSFSKDDILPILDKCNSIPRYRWGDTKCVGGISAHTAEDFIKVIDLAEHNKDVGMMLFHGVGGDWIPFSAEEHSKGIKELARRRDDGRVWCGSVIDVYKYECEREAATIDVQEYDGKTIIINLEISTDSSQYDTPLTILVKNCENSRGAIIKIDNKETYCASINNTIVVDVQPISQTIELIMNC